MNLVDIFIAVAYAGFFFSMQRKQFKQLYSCSMKGYAGVLFAFAFLMTSLFTSLTKNKHYRRGYVASTVVMPIVFYVSGMHYSLTVNLVFIAQSISYFFIGWYLVRKFQMHSF